MENNNKETKYKKCKNCGKTKDIELFRNQSAARDLHKSYCTECDGKKSHENYLQNKTRRLELVKNWQSKNPDKIKIYKKNWMLRKKEVIQKSDK